MLTIQRLGKSGLIRINSKRERWQGDPDIKNRDAKNAQCYKATRRRRTKRFKSLSL